MSSGNMQSFLAQRSWQPENSATLTRHPGPIRRGVPQKTAREISGHKTDAVFSRYNIVSEADIRGAARKNEQGAKAVIQSSFIVAP